MPQMIPNTLELQWNSIALLMIVSLVIYSCYVLPLISRVLVARAHVIV